MKQPIPLLSDCPSVIAAIDSELEYQNLLTSNRTDGKDHGVAGQLVTLERYVRKANDAWTDSAGEDDALHALRKCATIVIRALILYGVSARLRNGENTPIEPVMPVEAY